MKIIRNSILLFSFFILSCFTAFAWTIDHYEVILSKDKAKVWEAVDITIKAVDKAGGIITDYDGSILVFSTTDNEAEFPNDLKENTYTFQTIDEWKVKFENAVRFKNPWKQDVHVYNVDDDTIEWVAYITIEEGDSVQNLDITLTSPQDWSTIWKNVVTIAWTTQKNHQVVITVNSNRQVTTTSNSDWVFEKEVWELQDWENTIKASVLDSEEREVWFSNEIKVKVESGLPDFKSIKITPSWEMYPQTEIDVEVFSNKWLSEVKAILNDVITVLSESSDGIYEWKIYAPKELWAYDIDIVLKDDLWHETKKAKAEQITVIELNSAPTDTDWDWVPDSEDNCINVSNADQKDTDNDWVWDACDNCIKIKNANQKDDNNNWIGDVCEKEEEEKCEGEELDLAIKWLKLTELKTKSILTWDEIKWAWSYNIYKRVQTSSWGIIKEDIEFVENVTEPSYTVNIVGDEITYDYFKVKATWKNNCWVEVEWDFSDMVKVQTWPKEIFLIVLLAGILWFIFVASRKKRVS